MPRPRQKYNDCVVAVFREITGEDENRALYRFRPYLTGEPGISLDALSSCLKDAGWMLTPYEYAVQQVTEPDGSLGAAFKTFWTQFQGEAVVFYTKDDAKIGHAILVRSGGVVFDSSWSPENGEFIVDHFERFSGKFTIRSISMVTRMLNKK
ncbi:MAG TPA: hypothetical protein VE957_17635 [Terriglobales bacterium]|nr:hypothetical protein [Terriglobales bacterium]